MSQGIVLIKYIFRSSDCCGVIFALSDHACGEEEYLVGPWRIIKGFLDPNDSPCRGQEHFILQLFAVINSLDDSFIDFCQYCPLTIAISMQLNFRL